MRNVRTTTIKGHYLKYFNIIRVDLDYSASITTLDHVITQCSYMGINERDS